MVDTLTRRSKTGSENTDVDKEGRDIMYLSGGAALVILGAGVMLSHPALRKQAKAALAAVMPELQAPLREGVRGVLPDLERYLRLRGM